MDVPRQIGSLLKAYHMDFSISTFTIERYDDVLSLWRECEGVGLSSADSRDGVRSHLERNPGMSFVAYSEARLVGAASANPLIVARKTRTR